MKVLIATILIFVCHSSFGQIIVNVDSSVQTIDSLFKELNKLTSIVSKHDPQTAAPAKFVKTRIQAYDQDSSAIYFFDARGILLFRKVNRYNKNGCRYWEVNEIYNTSGRLSYREGWKWTCLDSSLDRNPDVRYFDAMLYEKERFTYDSLGLVKSRTWWYAPIRGVREYAYNSSGTNKETYRLTRKDEDSFWD